MTPADYNHVEQSIRSAVFNALEETGVDAAGADKIIETLLYLEMTDVVSRGLRDYKTKLSMNGGRPKPRSI